MGGTLSQEEESKSLRTKVAYQQSQFGDNYNRSKQFKKHQDSDDEEEEKRQ